MIDRNGFRANVGIVIINSEGSLLWARRQGQDAWQFPQGGIQEGETAEQAMYRELYEEVGLSQRHVEVMACTEGWLRYYLPKRFMRRNQETLCKGQKQKWFLLKLVADDSAINLTPDNEPQEFDDWRWVSYWYPLNQVIDFKREVYRQALLELLPSAHQVLPSSVVSKVSALV